MPESFGARLRQRREEQGVALVTIARQTRIKQSLLEALERDDVAQWPSGIYRRAFIRAYAHAIKLDPDAVVREFLGVHPEPPAVDVLEAMASALGGGHRARRPTTRLRNAVGSAIGSFSRRRAVASVEDLVVTDGPLNGVPIPAEPRVSVAAPAPVQLEAPNEVADCPPAAAPTTSEPDLLAVATLCTEFARIGTMTGVQPVLQEVARVLDADGLIVWLWDASIAQLKPTLVHGYSDKVVAQLPSVGRDADNATAAAFRSAETCAIAGSRRTKGALVVPLLTPAGCAGVLAIELQRGRAQTGAVRAVATIVAAMLAQLTSLETAEVRPRTATASPRWATSRL